MYRNDTAYLPYFPATLSVPPQLIVLDPAERMSARQAGEHPWLGDEGAVMLKRAEVEAVLKEAQETEQAEKTERMQFLRYLAMVVVSCFCFRLPASDV